MNRVLILGLMVVMAASSMSTAAARWHNLRHTDVQTIFFQGLLASQTQAAKYTDKHGFVATTGQQATCPEHALDVIQNVFIGKEIDEVKLSSTSRPILHPASLTYKLIRRFEHTRYGIEVDPAHDTSIQSAVEHRVVPSKISFGQETAMRNHKEKYELCRAQHPGSGIVLYGVSQGAAATFNALARHHYPGVKLAILESCFDSIENVFDQAFPLLAGFIKPVLSSVLPSYTFNGISPIKMISRFPKDIPVAIIASHADTRVPFVCSQNIAQALADAGHKQVYLLVLKNSGHARYNMDDEQDRVLYQSFVHALYKKYGLPYIAEYATNIPDVDAYLVRA